MALIRCPECHNEISDTIDQCIHCGYKLKEEKEMGIKDICLRGGPRGILPFIITNFALGLVFIIGAIVCLIIALTHKDLFSLLAITIVLGILSLLLFPAGVRDIIRMSKNNKIKAPLIKYDYDNDIIIVHNLKDEEIKLPIRLYLNIMRSFIVTSNLLFIIYKDREGKDRYMNLGYPLSDSKMVKAKLDELYTSYDKTHIAK